jgi:hypothetical protein
VIELSRGALGSSVDIARLSANLDMPVFTTLVIRFVSLGAWIYLEGVVRVLRFRSGLQRVCTLYQNWALVKNTFFMGTFTVPVTGVSKFYVNCFLLAVHPLYGF